jgi:hypothetical protein
MRAQSAVLCLSIWNLASLPFIFCWIAKAKISNNSYVRGSACWGSPRLHPLSLGPLLSHEQEQKVEMTGVESRDSDARILNTDYKQYTGEYIYTEYTRTHSPLVHVLRMRSHDPLAMHATTHMTRPAPTNCPGCSSRYSRNSSDAATHRPPTREPEHRRARWTHPSWFIC